MTKNSVFNSSKFTTGFTLIELLVVIAIIGILSTVVIASLNSAREKGKISSIKSTLKQLYNQAAINQVANGSFTGSNDANLNCTGNLTSIVQPLIDQGIAVKCYSVNFSIYGDIYQRFGAAALIYDTGELKAWSVDENGVVKWETQGVNSSGVPISSDAQMDWSVATSACSKANSRLPSIEQLGTLSYAWYNESGSSSYTPIGFQPSLYWSSVTPPNSSSYSYYQHMVAGYSEASSKLGSRYVRCVR